MYRFLFPLVLFCFAGPLAACSCGGTLSYAPIIAAPVVAFEKPGAIPETIETEIIETEERDVTTVASQKPALPAIPRSRYPDSVAGESVRKPLARLQIFDLPITIVAEQTVAKPPLVPLDVDSAGEPSEEEEVKQAETYPPDVKINEENEENEEKGNVELGQVRKGGGNLGVKPGPPEGVSGVSIPDALLVETNEDVVGEPIETDSSRRNRDRDNSSSGLNLSSNVSEGGSGGVEESQSWTVTVLVMLAALSTAAFLGTVFVVGEYRRRWLNAIMSQNGMPGFRGGLYDIPGVSIGYGRYED